MRYTAIFALALVLCTAAAAQAGWIIQERRGQQVSTIYIDQGRVRLAEPGQSTIFDTRKGTISWMDLRAKRFWTGGPQDLRKLIQKAYDQEMAEQLKPLSPQDRKKYQKAIDAQLELQRTAKPPEVTIKPSGESKTIAGYKADKYNIWVRQILREERWLADLPGLEKDLDLVKFFELVQATYPEDRTNWQQHPILIQLGQKGYPLQTIEYDAQGPADIMSVIRVDQRDVPQSLFKIPQGFKPGNPVQVVE